MFDVPVKEVMARPAVIRVAPDTSVLRAAVLMAQSNAGAVMVLVNERLVGIFTERDVVFRVVARELDPGTTPIADVMTHEPRTIGPLEPLGRALLIMHDNGFRHLPVLDDGKLVGVVLARSAMDPDLEEFASEAVRRESFARGL